MQGHTVAWAGCAALLFACRRSLALAGETLRAAKQLTFRSHRFCVKKGLGDKRAALHGKSAIVLHFSQHFCLNGVPQTSGAAQHPAPADTGSCTEVLPARGPVTAA